MRKGRFPSRVLAFLSVFSPTARCRREFAGPSIHCPFGAARPVTDNRYKVKGAARPASGMGPRAAAGSREERPGAAGPGNTGTSVLTGPPHPPSNASLQDHHTLLTGPPHPPYRTTTPSFQCLLTELPNPSCGTTTPSLQDHHTLLAGPPHPPYRTTTPSLQDHHTLLTELPNPSCRTTTPSLQDHHTLLTGPPHSSCRTTTPSLQDHHTLPPDMHWTQPMTRTECSGPGPPDGCGSLGTRGFRSGLNMYATVIPSSPGLQRRPCSVTSQNHVVLQHKYSQGPTAGTPIIWHCNTIAYLLTLARTATQSTHIQAT